MGVSSIALSDIGEKAFGFAFITAVISTVIGLAMIGAGVPPESFDVPIFMGIKPFYEMTYKIVNQLPQGTPMDVFTFLKISALILSGTFVQFLTTIMGCVLLIVQTIAEIVPAPVSYLVVPLYFVGAIIQVSIWVYLLRSLIDLLSSLTH